MVHWYIAGIKHTEAKLTVSNLEFLGTNRQLQKQSIRNGVKKEFALAVEWMEAAYE